MTENEVMSNIVAIVGRPNVGKSTLFNRLTGMRKAIIHESSGVTRDRHYGKSDWNGVEFSVIDTGGYVKHTEDIFEEEISKQVILAIDEADVILFMTDVLSGVTDLDMEVAEILRKSAKKTFVVVNKVDNVGRSYDVAEFYKLGIENVFGLSSINGGGTGELLDEVVKSLKNVKNQEELEDIPKFAIIGRPNVGKSSLVNSLIGQERNIVTPISGTTRDSVHTRYNKYGHDFYLIDTAGLRKKRKIGEEIEFYSTLRSVRAIEHADVCMLLVDAELGFQAQDMTIFSLVVRNNKGIVILVNKWDIIEKTNHTTKQFTSNIKEKIAPFTDIPVIFISALQKQRIFKALEEAIAVSQRRSVRIKTSQLNKTLLPEIEKAPPPRYKGKTVKIKYISQLPLAYPAFVFFCNLPQYIKEPYKRYVENKLRAHFNFSGVPVKLYFRQK